MQLVVYSAYMVWKTKYVPYKCQFLKGNQSKKRHGELNQRKQNCFEKKERKLEL